MTRYDVLFTLDKSDSNYKELYGVLKVSLQEFNLKEINEGVFIGLSNPTTAVLAVQKTLAQHSDLKNIFTSARLIRVTDDYDLAPAL